MLGHIPLAKLSSQVRDLVSAAVKKDIAELAHSTCLATLPSSSSSSPPSAVADLVARVQLLEERVVAAPLSGHLARIRNKVTGAIHSVVSAAGSSREWKTTCGWRFGKRDFELLSMTEQVLDSRCCDRCKWV